MARKPSGLQDLHLRKGGGEDPHILGEGSPKMVLCLFGAFWN